MSDRKGDARSGIRENILSKNRKEEMRKLLQSEVVKKVTVSDRIVIRVRYVL